VIAARIVEMLVICGLTAATVITSSTGHTVSGTRRSAPALPSRFVR
jgi:hypothetical protein